MLRAVIPSLRVVSLWLCNNETPDQCWRAVKAIHPKSFCDGEHVTLAWRIHLTGEYVAVSTKVGGDLLKEARRRRLISLEESLKKMHHVLDKVNVNEVVKLIREDRETR